MKIKTLSIDSFGKFDGKTLEFSDGINIVKGANEAGKSTAQQFIVNSLYGFFKRDAKGRRTVASYEKYLPWSNPNRFYGKITVKNGSQSYTIVRNFLKNRPSVTVLNEFDEDVTDQFEYNDSMRLPDPAPEITGLTRSAFENTLCVSQRECSAVGTHDEQLSEKLSAISQSADADISVTAAQEYIEKKLSQIGTERKNSPYKTVFTRISQLENELEEAIEAENAFFVLKRDKNLLENEKVLVKNEIAATEKKLDALISASELKKLERAEKLSCDITEINAQLIRLKPYESIDNSKIETALRKQETAKKLREIADNNHSKLESEELAESAVENKLSENGLKTNSAAILDEFQQNKADAIKYLNEEHALEMLESQLEKHSDFEFYETLLDEFDYLEEEKSAIIRKKKQKITTIILAVIFITAGILLAFLKTPLITIAVIGLIMAVFAINIHTDINAVNREMAEFLAENSLPRNCTRDEFIAWTSRRRGKLELKQAELKARKANLAELESRLDGYFSLLSSDDWKSDIDSISERVYRAKSLISEVESLNISIRSLRDTVRENESAIASLNKEISDILEECGIVSLDSLSVCHDNKLLFDELIHKSELLSSELERLLDGETLLEFKERCASFDEVDFPESEAELKSELDGLRARSELLTSQLSAVSERSAALSENTRTVGEVNSELDIFNSELDRLSIERDALELAKERLESISRDMHNEFAPIINRCVSDCASFISDGRYSKLRLTREFELFADSHECAEPIPAECLSAGTADMIYLCARMALTDFLSGEGEPLPLIFDDSFAYLDDERLAKFLQFVCQKQRQIIIFTCHSRESELLRSRNIPFNEIEL